MSKNKKTEDNKGAEAFLKVVDVALAIPGVKIDRVEFLKQHFPNDKYYNNFNEIIDNGPVKAGVSRQELLKIAKKCINFETTKVTALSTAAGIPGGLAMIGTIPADMAQFYAHVFRIAQKLMYIYGLADLNMLDDEGKNLLIVFLGIMTGVGGIETAAAKICQAVALNAAKKLAKKPLTKGIIYPVVKKVATYLGAKMTKEIFAKGVGKAIPVVGAVFSGTLTLATFKPMSHRLLRFFDSQLDSSEHSDFIEVELVEDNVTS